MRSKSIYSTASALIATLLFLFSFNSFSQEPDNDLNSDWNEVVRSGQGKLVVYWYENKPIFFKDSNGQLKGIEYEIIQNFSKFVLDSFNVKLSIRWVELTTFKDVYNSIKSESRNQYLGAARISITEPRRKEVSFTHPYMADISVLVTSKDLPIAKTKKELIEILSSAKAVTMKGTSLESDLHQLESENDISFHTEYRSLGSEVFSTISSEQKSFGYVSLLTYLFNFNLTNSNLNRQNFLLSLHEGYSFAYPKNSTWEAAYTAYFTSPFFENSMDGIISNYFDLSLYKFMETMSLYPDSEIGLLNKEKEIQTIQLTNRQLQLLEKTNQRNQLILIVTFGIIVLIIISISYRIQLNKNKALKVQQNQIEHQSEEIKAQSDEIKAINENLETKVSERTRELAQKNVALEEYSFIIAHNLRGPLARILGLVNLLQRPILTPKEQPIILEHLKKSSEELDHIVRSIITTIQKDD